MPNADQSLGQIARRLPGATAVFHRHKLDFCCGGNKRLRDAAAAQGLDAEAILDELRALPASTPADERDWNDAPAAELIDHLLIRYHAVHREQLPELIRLASRVEHVHGDRPDCPRGLTDHLQAMAEELDSHMRKEELVLFPLLIRGGDTRVARMPIGVMRSEHDHHGEALQRLAELTDDCTPPRGACTTWRALYAGLAALRDDLMQHIHLENNILFEDALRAPAAGSTAAAHGAA